jgi:hypothetical protein
VFDFRTSTKSPPLAVLSGVGDERQENVSLHRNYNLISNGNCLELVPTWLLVGSLRAALRPPPAGNESEAE